MKQNNTHTKRKPRLRLVKNVPRRKGGAQAGTRDVAPKAQADERLDLNRHIVRNAAATYYVRVTGDSMNGIGIYPASILVVDRSIEASDGDIIIARIGDELYVKRLHTPAGKVVLVSENAAYEPIEVDEGMDFEIWGCVTFAIRELYTRNEGV